MFALLRRSLCTKDWNPTRINILNELLIYSSISHLKTSGLCLLAQYFVNGLHNLSPDHQLLVVVVCCANFYQHLDGLGGNGYVGIVEVVGQILEENSNFGHNVDALRNETSWMLTYGNSNTRKS